MCAGHPNRVTLLGCARSVMFHELVYCFKEDLSSGFFKVPFALPLRAEHRLLARNGSELKRFNGDNPVGGDQRPRSTNVNGLTIRDIK